MKDNTSSASGKPSQPQSSKSTGQTQHTMATSQTLLPTPTARDGRGSAEKTRDDMDSLVERFRTKSKKWSSSLEASLASHSVTLDEETERQMTATSGLKCLQSYKTSDQIGSSLKTCVGLLLGTTAWFSKQCALTWKAKGTKSNRLLFQLSPSVRRTDEIGSGLLPTATTQEVEHPDAIYHPKTGRRIASNGNTHSTGLADKTLLIGQETGVKLRLQPAMTEWMMGFPAGWTELPYLPADTVRNV